MDDPDAALTDLTHHTPVTPHLVRGATELEPTAEGLRPHRLPAWARAQCDDPQLAGVEAQTSGVRLLLRTAATVLELETRRTAMAYVGAPPRPPGLYDLVLPESGPEVVAQGSVDGGDTRLADMMTGSLEIVPGPSGRVRFAALPPTEKTVEIWLPWNEGTELIAVRSDAPVAAVPADGAVRRWVHHGSSISHGSNAASATGTWPAVAARRAGVELHNLGFGGSALLDPFVARTIRDLPADLISVKLGINLVNADLMRRRALGPAVHGLLDTIRDGHPDTPVVIVSPIACPVHEETPGPSGPDFSAMAEGVLRFVATGDPAERAQGRLALADVREVLEQVVAARDDAHLTYLDGRRLYGPDDVAEHPLPDNLHPDAETHRLMGERFADLTLAHR